MERASKVGKWINVLPRARIHTVLGAQEFRDNLLLCYQDRPKNLPEKCDVCASTKSFTLQHALQ